MGIVFRFDLDALKLVSEGFGAALFFFLAMLNSCQTSRSHCQCPNGMIESLFRGNGYDPVLHQVVVVQDASVGIGIPGGLVEKVGKL